MEVNSLNNSQYPMLMVEDYTTNRESETLSSQFMPFNVSSLGSNILKTTPQIKALYLTPFDANRVENSFKSVPTMDRWMNEYTTAYTTKEHDVSERSFKVWFNKDDKTLIKSDWPKLFWPETMKTATFLTNRSLTSSISNRSFRTLYGGCYWVN